MTYSSNHPSAFLSLNTFSDASYPSYPPDASYPSYPPDASYPSYPPDASYPSYPSYPFYGPNPDTTGFVTTDYDSILSVEEIPLEAGEDEIAYALLRLAE